MYIKGGFSGYRGNEQVHTRGLFLLLVQPEGDCSAPIKACVRKVALVQFGAWMMGRARIHGQSVTVSGSYGGDGLPCNVSRATYDKLPVTLPQYLHDAWNKGEGWNSAGNEAPAMREWALDNLDTLRK